jgi:hypothetical protein
VAYLNSLVPDVLGLLFLNSGKWINEATRGRIKQYSLTLNMWALLRYRTAVLCWLRWISRPEWRSILYHIIWRWWISYTHCQLICDAKRISRTTRLVESTRVIDFKAPTDLSLQDWPLVVYSGLANEPCHVHRCIAHHIQYHVRQSRVLDSTSKRFLKLYESY